MKKSVQMLLSQNRSSRALCEQLNSFSNACNAELTDEERGILLRAFRLAARINRETGQGL